MTGRKTETVKVPDEWGGRDAGKLFKITEMPAARAEKWAMRAILLLQGSGQTIPMSISGLGMVGVAIIGLNSFLQANIQFEKLEPLMDEMFTCVQVIRDRKHPDVASDIVGDDDVQEIKTRAWLRSEVLRIHTGFSAAEAMSKLLSAIQTATVTPSA